MTLHSLEEHMLKKEHDNDVFSLVKAVTHACCNVRWRGTTWRNTIHITGKFIRKTMTKLKLFNYQSHSVLHAGIALALRKRLCFLYSRGGGGDVPSQSHCNLLNALLLMCFRDQYSSTFFFFPSQAQDVFRVMGEETGKLLLEICCNALRTETD